MNKPNMLDAKRRSDKEVKTFYYDLKDENKCIGKGKSFFIKTYGCQMNEHDSEKIKGILCSAGFNEVLSAETADIVILNTCAIRENAHNKVFGFLGRMKHLKETKKDLIVGLCGCMAQEEVIVDEIIKKYKWLNFVFGPHNIENLLDYIHYNKDNTVIESESIEGNICENIPHKRENNITAYVDIIYGCDKFCTYCIVPYTRGKQRSRSKEEIIKEVFDLKNKGYKQITLLGQNVNAYGKDIYNDYSFASLLEDVSNTGIERIMFVTSHPWDFTEKMIDIISKKDNIMPYIHLPFQSGSDRILKLMGRRYTHDSYLALYNSLRNKVKNCSITTDIIVGFPGETEEDFNETLRLVDECKFDGAFTFIYSSRDATPAASMKEQIDEKTKERRLHALNEKINGCFLESNKKMLGKIVKCLILSVSEKDDNKLMGYTEGNKLVNIEGDKSLIGNIVNVEITDAKSFSLDGKAL